MADHSEFVALAVEMLAEEGRKVTLQVLSSDAKDGTQPWNGKGGPSIKKSYPDVYSVFVPPYGRELGSIVDDINLFMKAEKIALIQPIEEGLEEVVTNILDNDNSVWRVVVAQALKPADQTVLYCFGLAR